MDWWILILSKAKTLLSSAYGIIMVRILLFGIRVIVGETLFWYRIHQKRLSTSHAGKSSTCTGDTPANPAPHCGLEDKAAPGVPFSAVSHRDSAPPHYVYLTHTIFVVDPHNSSSSLALDKSTEQWYLKVLGKLKCWYAMKVRWMISLFLMSSDYMVRRAPQAAQIICNK